MAVGTLPHVHLTQGILLMNTSTRVCLMIENSHTAERNLQANIVFASLLGLLRSLSIWSFSYADYTFVPLVDTASTPLAPPIFYSLIFVFPSVLLWLTPPEPKKGERRPLTNPPRRLSKLCCQLSFATLKPQRNYSKLLLIRQTGSARSLDSLGLAAQFPSLH